MGRIRALKARRRVLVGLILVAAVALAACDPLKAPVKPGPEKTPPTPPTAAFSSSAAPLVVSFTDQSTGDIALRWWDFGDNTASIQQNPTHAYATHGDYVVTLIVIGPAGFDSTSSMITVLPPPPVASFTANPSSGDVPLTVNFTDSSTGVIDSWSWDFDSNGVIDDTAQHAMHSFTQAGDHIVTLTVAGPGGSSMSSQSIPVTLPPPPVASFNAMPTSGNAPVTVNFTDTSTGVITNREWDFNSDGVIDATGSSATHTFSAVGIHQVTLLVTGPGGSSSATQAITVTNTPPVVNITAPANGASFVGGSTVTFTGTASDAQDGDLSASIVWNSNLDGPLGTGPAIASNTLSVGTHTITASASDSNMGTDTDQITVTIATPPPVASFNATPTVGDAPLTVVFTDTSTGAITGWSWNFGDGNSSSAQSPTHIYNAAGIYAVTLTVTGPGGTASASGVIFVTTPGSGGDDCGGRRCIPPEREQDPPPF